MKLVGSIIYRILAIIIYPFAFAIVFLAYLITKALRKKGSMLTVLLIFASACSHFAKDDKRAVFYECKKPGNVEKVFTFHKDEVYIADLNLVCTPKKDKKEN